MGAVCVVDGGSGMVYKECVRYPDGSAERKRDENEGEPDQSADHHMIAVKPAVQLRRHQRPGDSPGTYGCNQTGASWGGRSVYPAPRAMKTVETARAVVPQFSASCGP